MTLARINLLLLIGVLGLCSWLWSRDREARTATAAAQAVLNEARRERDLARGNLERRGQDLEEIREAARAARQRADETSAQATKLREAAAKQEREWTAALKGWEKAVAERDQQISQQAARESQLRAELERATERLREADQKKEASSAGP
jgi:hypothetical protein